jgi:methylphosphotriester-DNA--protein-cysteine methyltransferase
MGVNRKDSDNQTIAVKGNTQIADQDDNEIFVGSTGSNKYHLSDCRFVAKIKNKIFYKSSEEAKKDGKVPCKICNPR